MSENIFEGRYLQIARKGDHAWFQESHYDLLNQHWLERLASLGIEEGSILEVGCGVGRLASVLVSRGFEVTGIDVSETAIQTARQSVEARFEALDIQAGLPFPDQSFDVVIDSDCLHHLAGAGREAFFREAHRLLKPSGKLLVKTNVGAPAPQDWERFGYDPATKTTSMGGQVSNYFAEPAEIRAELEAAGFVIEREEGSPAGPDRSAQVFIDAGTSQEKVH